MEINDNKTMIKVDLIFSKSIYGQAGDRSFVRCMGEQKTLFAKHGVDLRIITPDLYQPNDGTVKPVKATWRHSLAMFITKHSAFATRLFIYLKYDKRSKGMLNYYASMKDKGEVVAFQDMIDCVVFLKNCKLYNQKVFLTLHTNGDFWSMWYYTLPKLRSWMMKRYRDNIERKLLEGVDKFGFVADLPRKVFCTKYRWDENKTFFVYNGIESRPFTPKPIPDKVKLICVGTLNSRKNQIGILNAIGYLADEEQKKIEVIFVGGGPDRDLLEKKSISLKCKVTFTGTTNEVDKYLMQANVFCLFSKAEGLPISIVEAMRAGLPVIGSKVAGIPEQIIDGKSGYVVELDENALEEKLHCLVNQRDLLPKMGEVSYRLFEQHFTIKAMVEKYSKVYTD